jgi:hypothetical protein
MCETQEVSGGKQLGLAGLQMIPEHSEIHVNER